MNTDISESKETSKRDTLKIKRNIFVSKETSKRDIFI